MVGVVHGDGGDGDQNERGTLSGFCSDYWYGQFASRVWEMAVQKLPKIQCLEWTQ